MGYGRPVWAEIDLSAIRKNMLGVRSLLSPNTLFCPIVKADAYGHGSIAVAQEAVMSGADSVGVAILEEAITLRDAGIVLPILVLGYTSPKAAHLVAGNNITQTIFTVDQAEALSFAGMATGKKVKVHVKIDTGVARLGVLPEKAVDFCRKIATFPGIFLEGIYTHFASADSSDTTKAEMQLAIFSDICKAVRDANINIPIRHCCNSAGVLNLPHAHFDMVRPGIILYGLYPSKETARLLPLEPALRLKARLSHVKTVPAGTSVGYGSTYYTSQKTIIGTIPIGYADGYSWLYSHKAEVFVLGQRAPLIGRVCMDQCMVDLTFINGISEEGTEVLLFGGSELPVEEAATNLGTINYEIICMIGKRVPRIYA